MSARYVSLEGMLDEWKYVIYCCAVICFEILGKGLNGLMIQTGE